MASDKRKSSEDLDSSATIKLPVQLLMALSQNAAASVVFDGLSAAQQREYIDWVDAARSDEARAKRSSEAVGMLLQGDGRKK
jgi:uncharacterized protein YdeI (YjbR/CyaY-like superfamily)